MEKEQEWKVLWLQRAALEQGISNYLKHRKLPFILPVRFSLIRDCRDRPFFPVSDDQFSSKAFIKINKDGVKKYQIEFDCPLLGNDGKSLSYAFLMDNTSLSADPHSHVSICLKDRGKKILPGSHYCQINEGNLNFFMSVFNSATNKDH